MTTTKEIGGPSVATRTAEAAANGNSTDPTVDAATIAAVIAAADAIGLMFATACADCGRPLVAARSLAAGRGPTCRARASKTSDVFDARAALVDDTNKSGGGAE